MVREQSAGARGGASTEAPRRSERLLQATKKRRSSHADDASTPPPSSPAPPRRQRQAAAKRSRAREQSAGARGGASTEAPRRRKRLLQATKKRWSSHADDASTPPPPSSPAPPRMQRQAAAKRSRAPSRKQDKKIVGHEIEGGGVDDAEAEFTSFTTFHLTKEEVLSKYKRLYKKRANIALAWYNAENQGVCYDFLSMLLSDVYEFMDGCVCYMHMNFKARNVASWSQKLFFAELALVNDVHDANSGYSTITCSIVDENCVGGKKDLGVEDWPVERYDGKNCYACAEKIKHPTGSTYKGGHYAEDYCAYAGSSDSE